MVSEFFQYTNNFIYTKNPRRLFPLAEGFAIVSPQHTCACFIKVNN